MLPLASLSWPPTSPLKVNTQDRACELDIFVEMHAWMSEASLLKFLEELPDKKNKEDCHQVAVDLKRNF